MSASDAAPLPRLGEVFFDVRGHSRSMRLSWYADTGIAVFSIWQGGRCTGTFRLPMDDLARMTEILQRGPQRRRGGTRHDREYRDNQPGAYDEADYQDGRYDQGQYGEGQHGEGQYGEGQYDQGQYGESQYDQGQYGESQYDEDWYDEDRAGGQRPEEPGFAGTYPGRAEANRSSAGHDSAGYERPRGYADSAGYERPGGYADSLADTGASDATGRYEFPARAARPEDGGYPGTAAGYDEGSVTPLGGYGQQRFVPPYVQPGGESYPNDNPVAGASRRHAAAEPAYPADRATLSAEQDAYSQPQRAQAGYFSSPEHQPPADPRATAQYSAGRHSDQRTRSSATAPFAESELDAPAEPISERDYWRQQAR